MRGGALSFSYLKSLLETGELRRMIGSLKRQSLSDEQPPQVGHAEETPAAARHEERAAARRDLGERLP